MLLSLITWLIGPSIRRPHSSCLSVRAEDLQTDVKQSTWLFTTLFSLSFNINRSCHFWQGTHSASTEQPWQQKRPSSIPKETNCSVFPGWLTSGATELAPSQRAKGLDKFHQLQIWHCSLWLKFFTLSATDWRQTTKYLLQWGKINGI